MSNIFFESFSRQAISPEMGKNDCFTKLPTELCLLILKQLAVLDLGSAYISCSRFYKFSMREDLLNVGIAKAFFSEILKQPTSMYIADDLSDYARSFGMLDLPKIKLTLHRQDVARLDFSIYRKLKRIDKSFFVVGFDKLDTAYFEVESICLRDINPQLNPLHSLSLKAGLDEANAHYAKSKDSPWFKRLF
jgi:hypothetical protein